MIDAVLSAWCRPEKVELLRDLCLAHEGYEKTETFVLLELWLWKVALLSFESTDVEADFEAHVDRRACRFRCGASFIVPAIVGFLGWDVAYSCSSSSSSAEGEDVSYSSSEVY